jgi:putative FmdB family regulatory protein
VMPAGPAGRPRPIFGSRRGPNSTEAAGMPGQAARARGYDQIVPIYEFRCASCGERFDALVAVGTTTEDCRACGAPGAERVLSAQAAPFGLVKTPGEARRQEARNA